MPIAGQHLGHYGSQNREGRLHALACKDRYSTLGPIPSTARFIIWATKPVASAAS